MRVTGGQSCQDQSHGATSPGSLRLAGRRRSSASRRGRGRPPASAARARAARPQATCSGQSVRDQFVVPPDLAVMNAANLCPASRPALEALARETQSVDRDPSPNNRARLYPRRRTRARRSRSSCASRPTRSSSRATPASRTTWCRTASTSRPATKSSLHADNHPSNLIAWQEKAQAIRLLGRHGRAEESAPGTGVLRRGLHHGHHAANEGAVLHAPVEHGRRPDAGEGAVPRSRASAASSRSSTARRASASSTSTSRTSSRTSTRAARTSGRAARASAACSTSTAPRRRSSGRAIYSAYPGAVGFSQDLRGLRTARRGHDDRVPRGAGVPAEGRADRHRAARARAQHAAHRGAERSCRA